MCKQHILAAEAGDQALLDLPIIAVALHQADIFVLNALAAGGFDDAQEHRRIRSRPNLSIDT